MIEHRWSQRTQVDHDVVLIDKDNRTYIGKIKNVGSHGLFIETNHAFTKNSYLQIRFELPDTVQESSVTLSALVIHCAGRGVGLMINAEPPHTSESLNMLARRYRA